MSRSPGFIIPSSFPNEESMMEQVKKSNKLSGFEPFDESDFEDSSIKHHGVKGMKWGVHKAANDSPNSGYSKAAQSKDLRDHGSRGVKRINRRLNNGKTLKNARRSEARRNAAQAVAVVGAYYAANVVRLAGPALMQNVAVRAETNRGRAATAAAMGLPQTASNGPTYAKQKLGAYNISSL